MISKKNALEILNACLETGGDYSEIYMEDLIQYGLKVENGISEKPTAAQDIGAGIRILKGLRSVYGYTNDISKNGLLKLAKDLSSSFDQSRILKVENLKSLKRFQRCPITIELDGSGKKEKVEHLRAASLAMQEADPRIVRAIVQLVSNRTRRWVFNSDGKATTDERTYNRLYFTAVASESGKIEVSSDGPGSQKGYEFVKDFNVIGTAKNVALKAIRALSAVECPSGRMPVVIGNGFGGVLFHEACGHSLEASSVAKGLSVFANKKGEVIASSIVNAYDDATQENGAWGTINYDDEGNIGEKVQLIKDGVLNDYMVDMFNGRRMNARPNGHSRRQNYRFEPTSRMTNTYIDNGVSTVEEIIKNTELGLYAKSMGGGSVHPTTGEFNFGCDEAYIIRNGKIAEQVKGAILIGSGQEVLLNIDMIANDLKVAQGMCGSSSGSIPTIVGQPTIRIKSMVVGGRGGELK